METRQMGIGLFEIDPDCLVEELALHDTRHLAGFFGETLEAEEAGGIALVDGDLEVAGAIEEGQFLALVHIGIRFAHTIDHFVAFEDDAEAAALALLLELFAGDVHDHVLEIVDEDDLPFYPVIIQ